ncbi:MAG: hypothetical protein ABSB01_19300 [Streptosporangiaceae bacterium]
MRPGYLADLAARTLGVAPVLRPATPSRFEPEGPQAELREITEVREAQAPPQRARETVTSASPQAQDGWAPGVIESAREPAQSAERSRRTAPPPARADTEAFPAVDRPPRGFFAADIAEEPGLVQPAQHSWATPDLSEPARESAATGVQVPADAATLTPDAAGPGITAEATLPGSRRAPWQEHLVQASRSRQQAQPPGRAGERVQGAKGGEEVKGGKGVDGGKGVNGGEADEAGSTEPVIVVRIGRVDVRAVQAAAPPAPAPRPRPAAGPSLAEHLAARDGRRR